MTKKNDPPFGEPLIPTPTLHPFSNNRELTEMEFSEIRLVSTSRYRPSEPRSVTEVRARIATAEIARDHLIKNDLIPVFDSFDFEGMFLKGARL